MSYSCTSRGNSSQDPSPSANEPAGSSDSVTDSTGSPTPTMKVKKGCEVVGVPATTEEELQTRTLISPEDVMGLQKITESKLRLRTKGGITVTRPGVC